MYYLVRGLSHIAPVLLRYSSGTDPVLVRPQPEKKCNGVAAV